MQLTLKLLVLLSAGRRRICSSVDQVLTGCMTAVGAACKSPHNINTQGIPAGDCHPEGLAVFGTTSNAADAGGICTL